MEIYISPTWTFANVVENIKMIKLQFEEVLSSFSVYELKKEIKFRKELRDSIYALNMPEWKKDKLWEYINDFEIFETLKKLT